MLYSILIASSLLILLLLGLLALFMAGNRQETSSMDKFERNHEDDDFNS